MSTNHVAAEEGERDEYGRGEDRLTEFLTLVENCISANQLRNACLDIKMVQEIMEEIREGIRLEVMVKILEELPLC